MNSIALALAAGAVLVLGGWCVTRAVTIGAPSVSTVFRRLYGDNQPTRPAPSSRWEQPVAAVGDAISRTALVERFAEKRVYELRCSEVSVIQIVTRTLSAAIVGFITAIVVVGVVPVVVSARVPATLIVAAPFAVGGLAGWYQFSTIMSTLKRRYSDFRAGVAAYIQLVSVCLTTRRSSSEAVTYAADIGAGRAFETISAAVHAAPQMGLQTWEALDAVGSEYGSTELEDLASSIANVSHIGVGVESTVLAGAARMRQIGLDDMQRQADRQTAAMFGPTMLFVVGTVMFLAYPLAIRVLDAFSTTT